MGDRYRRELWTITDDAGIVHQVEITIDRRWLAWQVGRSAILNRTRRGRTLNSAIVARVLPRKCREKSSPGGG